MNRFTFSLGALLLGLTLCGVLLRVAMFGYWPFLLATTVAGSISVTFIILLAGRTSLVALMVGGAVGGVVGCAVGCSDTLFSEGQPTVYLTTLEYERIYAWSMAYISAAIVGAAMVGATTGLVVKYGAGKFAGTPTRPNR